MAESRHATWLSVSAESDRDAPTRFRYAGDNFKIAEYSPKDSAMRMETLVNLLAALHFA
ncbi:MAG TPA: hypothetical protein VK789_15670 [Bryobacteraceae bacterium]|nr:hypothetical protein [Bryobacteraceae bacterium]